MLCLSRKSGEGVRLSIDGHEIWVRVGRVTANGNVLLAFDAPGNCHIVREELLARSGHDGRSEGSLGQDAPQATDGP